jgi:hypothetical protein
MANINFVFWNEEWQEHTEQKTQQGRGTYVPTHPKENDSKESWG